MQIHSRLFVVGGVATDHTHNTQTIDLLLLDRRASEELEKMFPKMNTSKILEFARKYSTDYISPKPHKTIKHERTHKTKKTNYHIGDLLSEETAFDELDYAEPLIETHCLDLVNAVHHIIGRNYDAIGSQIFTTPEATTALLSTRLRERKYLNANEYAIITKEEDNSAIHLDVLLDGGETIWNIDDPPNEHHPFSIKIPLIESETQPLICKVHIQQKNKTYELLTYLQR